MQRNIKAKLIWTRWQRISKKVFTRRRIICGQGQTVKIFSVQPSALDQVSTKLPDLFCKKESNIIKSERKIMVLRFPLEVGGKIKPVYMKQHNALSLAHRLASVCYASAAVRSLAGATTLLERGYATALPVAAVEYRRWGILLKSFYFSEEISGARTIESFWRDDLAVSTGIAGRARKHVFLRSLARLFSSLHANGIYHNDLKAANILVHHRGAATEAIFSLIDLQGLRKCLFVSRRRRIKNLAQLNRTLGVHLTRTEKLYFIKTYADDAFLNRGNKRDLVHRVLEQTSRQIIREKSQRRTPERCPCVDVLPKKAKAEGRQERFLLDPFLF